MNVPVNYWGVLLAVIGSFVVGAIWYHKAVFGTKWAKLSGSSLDQMNKRFAKSVPMLAAASFLTAYVLWHVSYLSSSFFGNSFMSAALQTAFWLWLGLSAPILVSNDTFTDRPKQLTFLNLANRLVTLLAMALVIGWVGV